MKDKKIKDLEERLSNALSQMAALQMRPTADAADDEDAISVGNGDTQMARKRSSVYLRRESVLPPLNGTNGYGPTLAPARKRHSLRPTSAGGASLGNRLTTPRGSMVNLNHSLNRSNSLAVKQDRSHSHANISRSLSENAAQKQTTKSKTCVVM